MKKQSANESLELTLISRDNDVFRLQQEMAVTKKELDRRCYQVAELEEKVLRLEDKIYFVTKKVTACSAILSL